MRKVGLIALVVPVLIGAGCGGGGNDRRAEHWRDYGCTISRNLVEVARTSSVHDVVGIARKVQRGAPAAVEPKLRAVTAGIRRMSGPPPRTPDAALEAAQRQLEAALTRVCGS